MKFSVATILAAAPAILASPVKRQDTEKFGLLSIRSGDINVHLRSIDAINGYFYIGRQAGNATTLQGSSESGFSLSTSAPGVQQVYVEATHGAIPGALAYNAAGSDVPGTGITQGFSVDDNSFSFAGASWVACPTQGAYIVQTVAVDGEVPEFCVGIAIKPIVV
ncbi:hypothetical protein C7974DRAFT_140355 [Boeremia exigua]|uniref:uncharacterized protein n=1 Tax=Boeremia exigua TaxID=749465 RepID=UPI001E8E6068|nr:uncharacterized protein C7974DRAFT_140355 [Boeremia exigua]KAH6637383.1 hypothetical protein C7974DRAFT_140355 [Boeremia exigua]